MTVGAIERKAGPYNYSDGAIYPFYFKVFSVTDIVVIKTDAAGAESELVLNNDFTVSLNDNQDNNPGGNISLSVKLTDQYRITISSGVELTQETVITNQGGFYPAELNKAFDKLTILCQQLDETMSRTVKVGISSETNPDKLISDIYESVSDAANSALAASISQSSAENSAEQAAESVGQAQQISDQIESRATEIVQTAASEATSQAEAAATSATQAEVSADEAKLHAEIANQRGIPIGTIVMFSAATPPAGYLKADGAAVGRETYPDLFAAIGTAFGEGDGSTTFNLPDLIGRFAQGSDVPGQKLEAGLPNAIQPPALTLLPCIKAFDAATNPGLIDITELANEMAGKVDRVIDGKYVRYVIDTYNDGTNWYRKWSDGWIEQGGIVLSTGGQGGLTVINLVVPSNVIYCGFAERPEITSGVDATSSGGLYNQTTPTSINFYQAFYSTGSPIVWYACGMEAS